MKQFLILLFILAVFPAVLKSQTTISDRLGKPQPYTISVSSTATTVLVFNSAVLEVDRGKSNLLATKTGNAENVLKIKASSLTPDSTSLHVFTADGRVNTFWVYLQPEPAVLTYMVYPSEGKQTLSVHYPENLYTPRQWDSLSGTVHDAAGFLRKKYKQQKMTVHLAGIYTEGDTYFFKLRLFNRGNLFYAPTWLQFYSKSLRKGKRTSQQQTSIPLLYHDSLPVLAGRTATELVVAINRNHVPGNKQIEIECQEINGGRPLRLIIPLKLLFKATPLQSFFKRHSSVVKGGIAS